MKYTHEIVGTHGGALLPERAPGACSGSKTPRVYRPFKATIRPVIFVPPALKFRRHLISIVDFKQTVLN